MTRELRLVSELMKNARRGDKALAQAVGVSQQTVRRMIRKFEEEGVIQEYTIIPDFRKLGYSILALVFIKLRQALTAQEIAEARRIAQETLKTGPFECIMLERGMGLQYDGVAITIHKDYGSYTQFKNWLRQFSFLDFSKIESFIINLDDTVHYRPLTFATLAEHLATQNAEE